MRRRLLFLPAVLLTLALMGGACSDDDDAGPDATPTAETTTTVAADQSDDGETDTVPDSGVEVTAEVVEFSTPDGVLLEGTLYGEGPDGIVLAHMRGADRSTWEPFAEVAAADGFRVLAFDFRGYGGSEGETDTSLDVDLTSAVEHLQGEGVDSVVVMGASMGGTATVNVASELDLGGIVSLSAPAEFQGLPALGVAADVEEPTMFISAADDQPYADAAQAMSELTPDLRRLSIVDGSAHGTNLFAEHEEDLNVWLLGFAADPANYS